MNIQIIICVFKGHKLNKSAKEAFEFDCCDRCLEYDVSESAIKDMYLSIVSDIFYYRKYGYKNFKEWVRCPECEGKYGKHDENKHDIPF